MCKTLKDKKKKKCKQINKSKKKNTYIYKKLHLENVQKMKNISQKMYINMNKKPISTKSTKK